MTEMQQNWTLRIWSWLKSRIDFIIFVVCIIIVYVVSAKYNFFETILGFLNKFNKLQLDELIPTVIYIAISLIYISIKRWKIIKRVQSQLEQQNTSLQKALRDGKQILEHYQKSNKKIQSIFKAAPVGIGVVGNHVFQEINDRFCEISGYSRDELIGQSSRVVHPSDEDFGYAGIRLEEEVNKNGIGSLETKLKRKNGEIIDVLLGVAPVDHSDLSAGVTFSIMDISQQKRMEFALIESEKRYRSFFEQDITGDVLTTVDGKILACNPAFAKMFGYETPREIMSVNVNTFYPSGRKTLLERLKKEKIIERINMEFIHREKRPLYCIGNLFGHFDQQGNLSQISAFYFDETERVLLEQNARETQKMEALGTLAGGIAHDFNNYLQSILGSAQLLKGNLPSESQLVEDINRIINVSLQAKALIKRILVFSRRSDKNIEAVYLQKVLQNVSNISGSIIPPKIEIHFDIQKDCPAVMADPSQLEQVAMNLIINAYQSVEQTNGKISVYLKEELIEKQNPETESLTPGRYSVLTVSDTGTGIDDDKIEKIFEPYFTTKKIGGGSGLGLSVVYGIVKEFYGSILFSSKVGKGSTFKVYLPIAKKNIIE